MIVRFYVGWWQMLLIDLPLIVASFLSITSFYLLAQRELNPRTWKRSILMMPALLAVGVALAVINTRAVLEVLLGIKTGFVRTAKYAIANDRCQPGACQLPAEKRLAAIPRAGHRNLLLVHDVLGHR